MECRLVLIRDDRDAAGLEPRRDGRHVGLPLRPSDASIGVVGDGPAGVQEHDSGSCGDRGVETAQHAGGRIAVDARIGDARIITPGLSMVSSCAGKASLGATPKPATLPAPKATIWALAPPETTIAARTTIAAAMCLKGLM
jgi:hypothetical protein